MFTIYLEDQLIDYTIDKFTETSTSTTLYIQMIFSEDQYFYSYPYKMIINVTISDPLYFVSRN